MIHASFISEAQRTNRRTFQFQRMSSSMTSKRNHLKARLNIGVSQMLIVEKIFDDRANCEPVSCINSERDL
jgi:hypothetical protein